MGTGKNSPTSKTVEAAKSTAKSAATKTTAKKPAKNGKKKGGKGNGVGKTAASRIAGDPSLFEPLTEGERADVLRLLIEDKRLANMAKVGRYRVIAVEPLVVKPPHPLTGHRLANVVAYDYASDRCVEASIDLDEWKVAYLQQSQAQPMLAPEEELAAVEIAMADSRVTQALSLGDEPVAAMHYWSNRDTELPFSRRSAAVVFGQHGSRPALVAVVNLIDSHVTEIVKAPNW